MYALVIATLVGTGVVTGLLFAFSNFVLAAIAELPDEHAMFAMQRINERIINPIFLLLFLGTPLACVGTMLTSGSAGAAQSPLVVGAMLYLAGPLGITVLRNVPLNNRLAATPAEDAATAWPEYVRRWQFWNHIRSYIGIAALAFLGFGAVSL